MRRLLQRAPIAVLAGAGLAAGLAARVLGAPLVSERLFLLTLVAGGAPLVFQTLRGLLRGRFAADIVATLAIIGAVLLGQYFAGAVIVLMQSGGETLERYALGRASSSLEALLARAPRVAHRRRDGQLEDVPVESVGVGDEIVVKPGDLVPVDATVLDGTSAVDESALTGEPLPVRAGPGTDLLSGSINLDGVLHARAVRPAAESQYQQIVRLVDQARREKPPIQRLADRFAVWFTPLTLAMCGVAYLVTGNATAVLAVLVVATPCPLILATPVAVIAGISRAADLGVIVKTGAAIEQLGLARAVVFDKTGTLTIGHPAVARVRALNGLPAADVLRLAAAVEQYSSHHLGRAIVEHGRQQGPLADLGEFQEAPGRGVSGRVDGRTVEVGSAAYLATRGIAVSETPPAETTAYVGVDGLLAGAIEFADRMRHQVPALLHRLAVLGVTDTCLPTRWRRSRS